VRDVYHWEQFGVLPAGNGMDSQPAVRIAQMQWTLEVRAIIKKQQSDPSWALHLSDQELDLLAYLYRDDDGRE
jgi:hypothetical protein